MGVLSRLNRFNAAHPWSHNDAFAPFVIRHARWVRRHGGHVALDVGCGTGNLLGLLAEVFPTVIGVEPDLESASIASRRFGEPSVKVERREFGSETRESYDLIVFVASLHHMSTTHALREAREALRPGGRLVIVGVARETPRDGVRSVVSTLLNPIVGLLRHPAVATQPPQHMRAPTAEAHETFDEIRAVASTVLPGIRMRRRLFWRYTAWWVAPRCEP